MNQAPTPRTKVLFLITKATWGGAQRYVFDLATHLPERQFDVSVAYGLPAQSGAPGQLKLLLKEKQIRLLPVPALGRDVALLSDIRSFFEILRLLRRERPDVLHVNSSKAAALGALAARLLGIKKIIFTAHGWPFKEKRNLFARAVIYLISWFTAFLSSATIVVSSQDQEIGKRMPLIRKKIRHIPLGIEPPQFLSREGASAKLGISTNMPRIVTIGELTANKGHRYAIEAVAELKQRGVHVEYFVIGEGELRDDLEKQARELQSTDHVHVLGFIEHAARYLKAFNIFLLPSIKEGMPYVLLEAAFADMAIVTTDVVDRAFFERYRFVRPIKPASAQALADAIQDSLTSQSHFGEYPTLESMLDATCALYRE